MIKPSNRGSLLFELFVALMILSIGITSMLRTFGEALFVGEKNRQRLEAKFNVQKLLFSWFAYPSRSTFPESGVVIVPLLGTSADDSAYWCEIRSKNLMFQPAASEAEMPKRPPKPSPYYQIRLHVTREDRGPVFDLDTVVLKMKQVTSS